MDGGNLMDYFSKNIKLVTPDFNIEIALKLLEAAREWE